MTEIQKSKLVSSGRVLVIEYWNLKFICNLVLVICAFKHKFYGEPRISDLIYRARFSESNKKIITGFNQIPYELDPLIIW